MASSLSKWRFWSTISIKLPSLCNVQAYTNHIPWSIFHLQNSL
jgi:hypothetical protein